MAAYQYNEDEEAWQWLRSDYSNSQGYYKIGALDTGTYRLHLSDWWGRYASEYYNNALELESATDVPVVVEQTTADIDAELDQGGRLTGTVSDANGTPLGNIRVIVLQYNPESNEWERIKSALTNISGQYDAGGLNTGNYRIQFYDQQGHDVTQYYNNVTDIERAKTISLINGQTIHNLNASLSEAGQISGSVTNSDGYLVPDIQLTAYQYNDTLDSWQLRQSSYTNDDGEYMVGGLSSGTYRLRFDESEGNYVTQYYDGADELENATDISVTAGQSTTAIDSQLDKAALMTGTVTDASANPLRDVHVEVYQYDQEEESWQSIAMDTTNLYGHYEVRGLNAGSYRVGFFDDDYLPQYYDGAGILESATDVEITAAQTSEGRDASLEMGATIEGTLTTADGQPVKDIWVQLYRNDDNGEWQAIGGDKSNTSGHYAVTGLLSDTYRIAFVDWAAHYATQYYPDATSLSNASDISVTSGETLSDIDSTLAEGGKISGALTTQLGEPVADIEVQAYRQEGNEWQKAGVSTTDSDGAYNLSGLSGGSYRIGFIDPFNRYPTQYYPNASQLSDATDLALTMGQSSSEINSALAEATEALAQATSESGSMRVQPETGEITVVQRQTNRTDVTISQSVTCPDDATPSKVNLLLNETSYKMSVTDKANHYTGTIPAEALLDGAEIKRQKTCQGEVQEEAIGQIQLFEPIGRIIDATTAQPLAAVTVALYHLPGWQARSSPSQDAANTCQSQRSKGDNQPWNQPAPTHLGTLATTDTISSTQNPIVTDADGYYGWNLSAGCWYVTTDAEAYDKLTSPLVGLPSDLTDLNLLLKRSERSIYLPLMSYQRGD